jgi:nitrate reductase gamma subunit
MRPVQSDTLSVLQTITLNKLRVKVDNKLGQCFNSHIGVRQGCFETFPFQFIYK